MKKDFSESRVRKGSERVCATKRFTGTVNFIHVHT
jgi:hypothetical protein